MAALGPSPDSKRAGTGLGATSGSGASTAAFPHRARQRTDCYSVRQPAVGNAQQPPRGLTNDVSPLGAGTGRISRWKRHPHRSGNVRDTTDCAGAGDFDRQDATPIAPAKRVAWWPQTQPTPRLRSCPRPCHHPYWFRPGIDFGPDEPSDHRRHGRGCRWPQQKQGRRRLRRDSPTAIPSLRPAEHSLHAFYRALILAHRQEPQIH